MLRSVRRWGRARKVLPERKLRWTSALVSGAVSACLALMSYLLLPPLWPEPDKGFLSLRTFQRKLLPSLGLQVRTVDGYGRPLTRDKRPDDVPPDTEAVVHSRYQVRGGSNNMTFQLRTSSPEQEAVTLFLSLQSEDSLGLDRVAVQVNKGPQQTYGLTLPAGRKCCPSSIPSCIPTRTTTCNCR